MSGHPGAVLCGQYHGAVDHAVKGHGQLFVGYPIFVKGHHFLAARKTPTSYAPAYLFHVTLIYQVATVTGWGSTAYGGSPSSTLQEVNVTVISNDECSSAYGDRIKKYEKSIV